MPFSTPIVLMIYRRPQHTQEVFNQISVIKPRQLFVIADGPHPDRPQEVDLCHLTREIISQVDWDCDVFTNYADSNMGLANRVSSGITWVFEQVERAIILEDDCRPHLTFFHYCEMLLEKYATNPKIMSISGYNAVQKWKPRRSSYFFSQVSYIWGWATWRDAWKHYNHEITQEIDSTTLDLIVEYLSDDVAKFLLPMIEQDASGQIDSWAVRWACSCILKQALHIVPSVNLVSNIGFDNLGAHTTEPITYLMNKTTYEMNFPLKHPKSIHPDSIYERNLIFQVQGRLREQSLLLRIKRRLSRLLKT